MMYLCLKYFFNILRIREWFFEEWYDDGLRILKVIIYVGQKCFNNLRMGKWFDKMRWQFKILFI